MLKPFKNEILLMRKKGLSGVVMSKHANLKHHVSKSVGAFIGGAKPFPPLSDSVIFEAYIEDGADGTIVANYNDDLEIATPFNINAFKVLINGVKAIIDGVSIDPVDLDHLLIEFHPPVFKGDVVTFQYDARIDPGFTDSIESLPINNALNPITNHVQTEAPPPAADDDFGPGFGDGFT